MEPPLENSRQTLCADEVCPIVPGNIRKLHWPFPDPAGAMGSESEQLEAFRDVRDAIDRKMKELWSEPAADGRRPGT